MLRKNIMMSCARCLAGHRASSCNHYDRALFAIKNKGRGAGLNRSNQMPDFPNGSVESDIHAFHQAMMDDPKMYREYYHETRVENPTQSASTPSQQPTTPSPRRQQGEVRKVDDMYTGSLTPEQVDLWQQLCGYKPMDPNIFPKPDAVIPEKDVTPSIATQDVPPAFVPAMDTTVFDSNVQLQSADIDPTFQLQGADIDPTFQLQNADMNPSYLDFSQLPIPFENMTMDDFVAGVLDPAPQPELMDVVEPQQQHSDITFPETWSPEINALFGDTADGQEMSGIEPGMEIDFSGFLNLNAWDADGNVRIF
jgi:Copper fist DNA binding domain